MKLILWKDTTFFSETFINCFQQTPEVAALLGLWNSTSFVGNGLPGGAPTHQWKGWKGGKHLQQRRWGGWNWWNHFRTNDVNFQECRKQSTCTYFLNGRPHLFHCPSSRGKGRCSQFLVICKRQKTFESHKTRWFLHVSTTYYTQWDHQRTQICCRRLLLRRRRSLQSKSIWNLVEFLLNFS